jgi:hypothetical protein
MSPLVNRSKMDAGELCRRLEAAITVDLTGALAAKAYLRISRRGTPSPED